MFFRIKLLSILAILKIINNSKVILFISQTRNTYIHMNVHHLDFSALHQVINSFTLLRYVSRHHHEYYAMLMPEFVFAILQTNLSVSKTRPFMESLKAKQLIFHAVSTRIPRPRPSPGRSTLRAAAWTCQETLLPTRVPRAYSTTLPKVKWTTERCYV